METRLIFQKLFRIKVLSDIHNSLGKEYVPYIKFISRALTKVNTKLTDVKNIHLDYKVSNTENCDIKHTSTPTKYVPNNDNSNVKHTITPTKHGLPDPILSKRDVIYVHQQKVKTLAEMEREVRLK